MAFRTDLDRGVETATITGTGSYTLAGAVAGHVTLATAGPGGVGMANGDTALLQVESVDANGVPNGGYEIGIYTWATGAVLSRTTIFKSSNSGAAVSWGTSTLVRITTTVASAMFETGHATTSSAVDITLTSGSSYSQRVAMTADYKSVVLPDATTLVPGWRRRVENTGAKTFAVKGNGGVIRAFLGPNQVAELTVVDISTAAGVWQVANLSPSSIPLPVAQVAGAMTTFVAAMDTSATFPPQVVALSATKYLVAYVVSGTIRARVLDISSGAITAGTELATGISVHATNLFFALAMMDATHAILTYSAVTTGNATAVAFSVSVSTVTAGSAVGMNATSSAKGDIVMLTSTTALAVYQGVSGHADAVVLSLSGTTITSNTVAANIGSNGAASLTGVALAALTSAKVLLATQITSASINFYCIDISGTTPASTGTSASVAVTANSNPFACIALSSTQAVVLGAGGGGGAAQFVSVSGSNVSLAGLFHDLEFSLNVNGWWTAAVVSMSSSRGLALMSDRAGPSSAPYLGYSIHLDFSAGAYVAATHPAKSNGWSGTSQIANAAGAITAAAFDTTRAVVVWQDAGAGTPGQCVVLDMVS